MAHHQSVSVRHNIAQETPVPTYTGMMLHAHTCKRALIDRLSQLGISISYDCVLQLSTQMGKSVCQQLHRKQVVCPPATHGQVFTTAAIDNIDHNPVPLQQRNPSMVLVSLHFSIPLLLVKELKDLWMQAPRTLATCHTTTLMCRLSQPPSNIQLSLLLDRGHRSEKNLKSRLQKNTCG